MEREPGQDFNLHNDKDCEEKSQGIEIPENEYEIWAARSGGKGGQNVNKVSSKACLRWNLFNSQSLTPEQIELIALKLKNQLTKNGDLVIASQEERSFEENRKNVLSKLTNIINNSLIIPKERVETQPTFSSQEKRIKSKKIEARKKELRKSVQDIY